MHSSKITEIQINKSSCEGCGKCVEACSQKVLILKEISDEELKNLSLKGRLKTRFKGRLKSSVNIYNACIQCKTCEKICRERAIKIECF
jgi:ferredoxin